MRKILCSLEEIDLIINKKNKAPKRVGLFGGSFNPPHKGHLAVACTCYDRLQLDGMFWLVAPSNPLKQEIAYAPLERRAEWVKNMIQNAKDMDMYVSIVENTINAKESIRTVEFFKENFPHTRFVWIMGSDVLREMPEKWPTWKEFIESIVISVYPRPPIVDVKLVQSILNEYSKYFLDVSDCVSADSFYASFFPPLILWLSGNRNIYISSTEIRNQLQ